MLNQLNQPDYIQSTPEVKIASCVAAAIQTKAYQAVGFSGSHDTDKGGLEVKLQYGGSTVYQNDISGPGIISEFWHEDGPISALNQAITLTVTAATGSANANLLYRILF